MFSASCAIKELLLVVVKQPSWTSSTKRIPISRYYAAITASSNRPCCTYGIGSVIRRTFTNPTKSKWESGDEKKGEERASSTDNDTTYEELATLEERTRKSDGNLKTPRGEKPQPEAQSKLLDIISNTFVQDIKALPNLITLSRILCTPALGYCIIVLDNMEYAVIGCGLVAFSDWIDGYIAKGYNQRTILGAFLDPIADKWTIAVLSTSLAYKGILPTPLVCLWLLRDTLLIGYTYSYMKHQTTQLQKTTIVEPTNISKVNTTLQFLAIACAMITHNALLIDLPYDDILLPTLYWTTAGTTILSGYSYLGFTAFSPISPTTTTTTTTTSETTTKEDKPPLK